MSQSKIRSVSQETMLSHHRASMSMIDDGSKKSDSCEKSLIQTKLPLIQIKKVMRKIGAADKFSNSFIPSDEERLAFRKSKEKQLREQFSRRKGKKQPFDYQLDQIVLDCWDYGQNYGRRTIWKKYKQKFDELTFDTLRAVHNKKI